MNIDNLTISEVKQIVAMFSRLSQTAPAAAIGAQSSAFEKLRDDLIVGKFCIARCYSAGVHAGYVEAVDGENVILRDSVRLWSWKASDGIALSGVAQHGIKTGCKIDTKNPVLYLTGVCELIPCSEQSKESIDG